MPETFVEQVRVADVYAGALFELAHRQGLTEQVRAELETLVRLARENATFAEFLRSAAIDDDRKAAQLERWLRGRVSDLLVNTLLVMNRHGRLGLLEALLRAFVLRAEQAAGQIEACVRSAVELDESLRARTVEAIRKVTGRQPLVEYRIDPELIGGLVVEIGDIRFDSSIRRQLDRARQKLHQRAETGLSTQARSPGG